MQRQWLFNKFDLDSPRYIHVTSPLDMTMEVTYVIPGSYTTFGLWMILYWKVMQPHYIPQYLKFKIKNKLFMIILILTSI